MQSPEHYWERARFMRKQAEEATNDLARGTYLRLAWDYEELAERATLCLPRQDSDPEDLARRN